LEIKNKKNGMHLSNETRSHFSLYMMSGGFLIQCTMLSKI